MAERIRIALDSLNQDPLREGTDFSAEFRTVHDVLIYNPYATERQREEALNLWIQRFQPCLFGKVAAAQGRIHYCLISADDLAQGEEWVSTKIRRERRLWKARAVDPIASGMTPAHSFVLHISSPRIARAAPDNALRSFALLIRELWGCPIRRDSEGNDMATETLYLKAPSGSFHGFGVNLDFFAAQGDGRWWHDHRIPGGIAFTANATGHMARYREWYEAKPNQNHWTLSTAMLTIDEAKHTPWGKATELLPLEGGQPFVPRTCPFEMKARLRDKDWTRYRGYYDTDHSVRSEFFQPGPERATAADSRDWLQDFTYVYDVSNPEHTALMLGEPAPDEELEREIGSPSSWRRRPGGLRGRWIDRVTGTATEAIGRTISTRLRLSLAECRKWALSHEELAAIEDVLR